MGWETRGNRTYYYQKRRQGGRVISEYVGNGETAALIAQLEDISHDDRERERQVERIRREDAEAFDAELKQVYALIETLTEATLLDNGFHKHKGQWRRKRDEEADRAGGIPGARAEIGASPGESRAKATSLVT